jgi:hypothetical protein
MNGASESSASKLPDSLFGAAMYTLVMFLVGSVLVVLVLVVALVYNYFALVGVSNQVKDVDTRLRAVEDAAKHAAEKAEEAVRQRDADN